VYYMGSEDADLDELGHIFINGQKHQWQTKQTGAVGRMVVDKNLINLITNIAGQVAIFPFGNAIIEILKTCYKEGETIEAATFNVVNHLFKTYGVLVVLPDNADLKRLFAPVIEKELTETFSHQQVETTVAALPIEYKVQASGRALNLFYLKDNRRDRIEWNADKFRVTDTAISFTKAEILQELKNNPERFSPNVILRPVFQETILPNIAFIGGGGELAYWLELKKVFETEDVPYPVMVLRNSFLVIEQDVVQLAAKLNLTITDLFKNEQDLINKLVKQESTQQLSLQKEQQAITTVYATIKTIVDAIDVTLAKHTEALKVQALKKITNLEKKMLRAERKKFEAQQRKIHKLKTALFPTGNLQERIENIIPFYAKWGDDFIDTLYQHSLTLQQEFVVLQQD
jgi:bacillithiol synthase